METKLFDEFNILQEQINLYKKNQVNIPKALYMKQFDLLTQINDDFKKQNYEEVDSLALGIKYNMRLKYLAEKIGKPTDEYKQKIRDYSLKMTGKDVSDEEMTIID